MFSFVVFVKILEMKTIAMSLCILTSVLLCAVQSVAVEPDPAKFSAVGEKLNQFIAANEFSGAVTLVATKSSILHLEATGQADVENKSPMQKDSIFWIASMTKPITGAAIMMLQDEGKLSIDDPVAKFIPEFALIKTPSGTPANLTIKHLLTHTSGLAENSNEQTKAAKSLADLIPGFMNKPTQFEPGSKWQYCQTGINTLGRIIEVISGQSYDQFLAKRIFEPLGMKDTTFYPTKEQQARIARSYRKTKEGKLEPADIFIFAGRKLEETDRVPLANGGLFSTASDYARFLQMVLNEGSLDGKHFLKPATVKQMISIQSGDVKTGFTPGNGWGCAWCVVKEPQGVSAMLSPGSAGHGGAYGTQAWIDPVKGVAYVLMVQRANFPNSDDSEARKVFQQTAADAMK